MTDRAARLGALTDEQRAKLERLVRARRAPRADTPAADPADWMPLSPGQRRMWFLHELGPRFPEYTVVAGWRVDGPLDRAALTAAFGAVLGRHPMLRAVFAEIDGEPRQRVRRPVADVPVDFADFSKLPKEEWHAATERAVREQTRHRYDLVNGPLARLRVIRMADDEHRILFAAHHIVMDGWTLSVVVSDLLRAYDNIVAGRPPDLPPLSRTYADFVGQDGEKLDGEFDYWRRQLDRLPTLVLPADRPRPAEPDFRAGRHTFWLDQGLTAGLHRLARELDGTLFTVLLAGFQALLSRYTATTDIAVGTPISIRPGPDFDEVAGLFLNTLVLRGDQSADPSFADLVRQSTGTAFAGYDHRLFPFERLVDRLAGSRDLTTNPLFQVMLVLQNTPPALDSAGGLRFTPLDLAPRTAKFDLNLQVTETGDRLRCDLDYAAELFSAERIGRLAGHFRQLLTAALERTDRPVSTLPLLLVAENALVAGWNRTAVEWPVHRLPARFAATAAQFPDRPAVHCDGDWLSYGEIAARVNRLARRLLAMGVGRGSVVGVCLDRGLDLVVALHAIHAAGAAYLPLDPAYPAERREFMARDAGATLVLTDIGDLAAESADPLEVAGSPDDLAYVIYTSGSTGKPKGVGISHRSAAHRIWWMQRMFPLAAGDRVLQKTPMSFDVSVWEFFWALTAGAGLVIAPPGAHRDSGALVDIMARTDVTTVHFVPSMLDAFVAEPSLNTRLPALRQIFCSGEALKADLARRCLDELPQAQLHNLYGPTEAAVDVTWQPVSRADVDSIGRPVPNTSTEILDGELGRVGIGVPGELCLGGIQLARGYLGRPGLTADRFVPNPYGEPGTRLYRTGDRARWRADGRLEFLGRLDTQIKLRGMRIELGEIEAVLAAQPEIRAAAVDVRADRLVAYLVTAESTVDWAGRLRRTLPAHFVPDDYLLLDALPLTHNGKLDRAALPDPTAAAVRETSVPLQTPTERLVADIWAAVLDVPAPDADADFFGTGGDSIRSLKVVSRLKKSGFAVTLADLFGHRTVRALAAHLDRLGRATPPTELPKPSAFGLLDPADLDRLANGGQQ